METVSRTLPTETKAFLHPLNNMLVIEPLKESKTSLGGIILPDSTRESGALGRVFAVGRGRPIQGFTANFHKPEPRAGEEVLYFKGRSTPISVEGLSFVVIDADDVLAIVGRPKTPPAPITESPATAGHMQREEAMRSKSVK